MSWHTAGGDPSYSLSSQVLSKGLRFVGAVFKGDGSGGDWSSWGACVGRREEGD